MAGSLKAKARKALDHARITAHAVIGDVSAAAHDSLISTEADVQKVSGEVKTSVSRAVADAKIATDGARTKLRKK